MVIKCFASKETQEYDINGDALYNEQELARMAVSKILNQIIDQYQKDAQNESQEVEFPEIIK